MRRAPRTVKVGPYKVSIRFDKDAMAAASANGAYLADLSTVLLAPNNSRDVEQDTLLHEVMHAVWKQAGLSSKWPDDEQDSDGEHIINVLAPRLLEVLKDNPTLVEYLTS